MEQQTTRLACSYSLKWLNFVNTHSLHSSTSYISIDGLNWVRYLLSLNSIESCLFSILVIQIFEMLTSVGGHI